MQQIYRGTPMPKCDFNRADFIEITLRLGGSPVNLLHICRTPFYKNTYGGLLLHLAVISNLFYLCQIKKAEIKFLIVFLHLLSGINELLNLQKPIRK